MSLSRRSMASPTCRWLHRRHSCSRGFLAGNIVSGLLLALFMPTRAGYGQRKKLVESGVSAAGSLAHKAAVIGDTVGDPCKDTAGPSINTQITVVSLVASLAVGLFALFSLF